MLYIAPWKKIAIILLVIVGILFALPNALNESQRAALPGQLPDETVNLGLDLQGGAHVLVEAEMEPVFEARMEQLAQDMRDKMRDAGNLKRSRPVIDGYSVTMRVTNPGDVEAAREAFDEIPTLLQSAALTGVGAYDFEVAENPTTNAFTITLTEGARDEIVEQTILRSIEVVRRRIDPEGIKEASVTRQGTDRILIQVPGAGSAAEIVRVLDDPAVLGFHTVNRDYGQDDLTRGRVKAGYKVAEDAEMEGQKWAISRVPLISGEDVVDAGPGFSETGEPIVTFRFNSRAGKAFGNWSLNNVGELFAIVVDGRVISAPSIREPILGGSGQISGSFTVESSTVLAVQIASGALPAKLVPLEQRTVGPELGADSIAAGQIACMIGLLLVILFMIVVYGKFGVYANVALIVNLALILGVLSALGATLTLPGIAGIVLTIGMAVDANVLIFERIREELESVKGGAARAIETGYEKALTAIVDANITTLIAALILYAMGSGPVKGFAVTLGIGIVTSVFTAFFVTRLLVVQWFEWKRPKTFKITLLELVRNGTKIRFLSGRKVALTASAVAVVASIGLFAVNGLNYGIDFKGGTLIEGRTPDATDLGDIRTRLEAMDLGDVQVQGFGSPNDSLIRVEDIKGGDEARKGLVARINTSLNLGAQLSVEEIRADTFRVLVGDITPDSPADAAGMQSGDEILRIGDTRAVDLDNDPETDPSVDEIVAAMQDYGANAFDITVAGGGGERAVTFENGIGDFEIRRVESLGAKVSGELVTAGIMAILLAIGSVLVYIWLRFEWQFSVGAVGALAHDVILTIGVFSLIGLEFNLSIIAAILTIVGYSLNDTVVVFDRVRENLRRYKKMVLEDLLNLSLNETLSRTLMTSITTLLALLALYFLGGAVLQGFTFAMIWGVLVGTYSSVYIASPILQLLGVKRDWSKPEDDTTAMGVQFGGTEKA